MPCSIASAQLGVQNTAGYAVLATPQPSLVGCLPSKKPLHKDSCGRCSASYLISRPAPNRRGARTHSSHRPRRPGRRSFGRGCRGLRAQRKRLGARPTLAASAALYWQGASPPLPRRPGFASLHPFRSGSRQRPLPAGAPRC